MDVDPLRPVLDVVGEGRAQAEIVERRWPELPDQVLDVAVELLGHGFECFDLCAQVGPIAARGLEHSDAELQRRQLLAELIVHLARDPPPLVLLGKGQPGVQLRAGAFGKFALPDLLAEGVVGQRQFRRALADAPFQFFMRATQQLFGALSFGQVEVGADDSHDRPAWLAANGKASREHMNVVPILVAKTKLAFVGPHAAGQALVELTRARPIVGMQQPLPRAHMRLNLLVGVAEHFLPSRRVHDRAGLEVPVEHAFLRAREGHGEPLFALAEGRFGVLAPGNVAHGDLDGADVAVFDRRAGDLDVGDGAVDAQHLCFGRRDGAAVQQLVHAVLD